MVGSSGAWPSARLTSAGTAPTSAAPRSAAPVPTAIEAAQASSLPIGYVPTAQVGAIEPMVQSSPEEPRWRREIQAALPELERLRARLPGPLSRLPLVAFPAAFGAFLLLIVVVVAWPRSASTSGAAGVASSTPPSGLTDAQLADAKASGPAALEALAERFPKDLRVTRALLQAYHDGKRHTDAVKTLAKLAETEKNLLAEDLPLAVLKGALEGPSDAMEAAFTLLESGLGAEGVEVLYGLWTAKKDVSEKVRARAGKSLAKPEVKELALKPTRVLIDLKVTPASCETRKAAVALALEAGDARAVPLLQGLTSKRGCGFAGLQDCWGCLRNSNQLNEAIKAAEKRPAP